MVIARGEIDGGEAAAFETLCRPGIAAEELGSGEMPPLGLEDPVFVDPPDLADSAIGGAENVGPAVGQRTRAGLEFAGEEIVEALELLHPSGGLPHVDIIGVDEPADEEVLEPDGFAGGDLAGAARNEMVRKRVLQPDEGGCHGMEP